MPSDAARELIYRKCSHWNLRRYEECRTLIEWLEARPGEKILDIGCGDGFWDHRIACSGASVVALTSRSEASRWRGPRTPPIAPSFITWTPSRFRFQTRSSTR